MDQMTKDNLGWKENWESFVEAVAQAKQQHLSDSEVTERFCNQTVYWVGKVEDKNEEPSGHFGIDMRMKNVSTPLENSGVLTVDFLYLNVAKEDALQWQQVAVGSVVQFETSIETGSTYFPGIRWSKAGEGEHCATLMIGTKNSKYIETISNCTHPSN